MSTWTAVIALLFAFSLDLWLGRPASPWHPLVWMRKYLELAGRRIAPHKPMPSPDWLAFSAGALGWYCGASMVVLLAWLLQWSLLFLDPGLAGLVLGASLKPMVSWRFPRLELLKIEAALAQSLEAGRRELGLLVKRDVTQLDEIEVRESAIECLAEHLNVSVVAPVFWFFLAGLPGAVFYRYVNLAGAMWGNRGFRDGGDWAWAGKWAARADDLLTWLPARLTAVLIAAMARGMPWRELPREAGRTPSPNSGWPTAAMALALGRRLRKPGVCVLNETGASPDVGDSGRALSLSGRVVAVVLACTCVGLFLAWERPW
jgi:adenosylcobinamide-phosphate synthase